MARDRGGYTRGMVEREPATDEDPREQEAGSGGYPETQPPGHDPGGAEPDPGGDAGGSADAPDTSSPSEGDAGQATGTPGAAG